MDDLFMSVAIEEARIAFSEDEVPVGACLVKENRVVLRDHNRTRQSANPLAHAEKIILDSITQQGVKYLYDYTLYVTLEPCSMCSGMLVLSRISRVVYGALDPKAGAVGSVYNLLREKSFNHHPEVVRGVLQDQCSYLLTEFFQKKR